MPKSHNVTAPSHAFGWIMDKSVNQGIPYRVPPPQKRSTSLNISEMPEKGKGKEVAHDEQPMDIDKGEGMSTGALIKKHQPKMAWSMAGWHGGATLYHPQGCKKSDDYVTHTVEASNLNQLNVLRKDIDHALKVAWPGIIRDIEDDAISGIREDFDNLQYNFDQLLLQLDEAWQELNLEKGRSAHLKSELKRYQSASSDTHNHSVSKLLLTTTPPTASSSHMTLDQPPVVSSSQMALDKTPKKSFGKQQMLGSDEMIDLDKLPESQAALIAAIGGPVNQQLLDATAPIEDGEAFIQYLHEEALENTQEVEERAATKRAPKRKHLNECLTEEEAIEIAPHTDLPFEVLAGDSRLLKLGSHYVRADPPIPITGQLPWPIGKAQPVNQDWFDVCDLQSSNFLVLVKEARHTLRDQLTHPIHAALRRATQHSWATNVSLIMILPSTPVDTQPMLRSWQLNPHGVPPAVRQEDDGTMHLLNVDVWMWVQAIAPKTAAPAFWRMIWKLFQQPGQWAALVGNTRIPPPMGDTLWSLIKRLYKWGTHTSSTVPIGELALWMTTSAGITTEHAQWLEHFAARVASGEAHNEPARASKSKKDAGEQRRIKMFPKQLQRVV